MPPFFFFFNVKGQAVMTMLLARTKLILDPALHPDPIAFLW